MRNHKILLVISTLILFAVIAVIVILTTNIYRNSATNITWNPSTQHSVISDSQFEKTWSSTSYLACQTCLFAKNNELYYVGAHKQNSPLSLIKLDIDTGQVDWAQRLNERSLPTHSWLNSDQIYIGFNGTQKIGSERQLWGASHVNAHEITSGNQVWSSRIPGANKISFLSATDDTVFVIGNVYLNLVMLDVETGQLKTSDNQSLILFEREGIRYSYQQQGTLISAIHLESGELIWQRRQPLSRFTFLDDTILVKTENSEVGVVIALDALSGEILWEQKGVVSNIAADNGIVYLITFLDLDNFFGGSNVVDAHLIAIDIKTGNLLGTLNFEPSGISSGNEKYTYSIAASNNIITVYLGDGGQLFALRFVR